MNIEVSKESLVKAVGAVAKIVSVRPTTPALANILIEAEAGGVKLISTNLDTTIKVWLPAKSNGAGKTTLPARVFAELLSGLKEEKITLTTEKEKATIKTDSVEANLPTISAEEFPTPPEVGKQKVEKVNREKLVEVINKVAVAASQDDSRLILTGVLFRPGKEGTKVVATDGYRLALKEEGTLLSDEVIISARDLSEVAKVLSAAEDDSVGVAVSAENNQVGFITSHSEYYTKLISGDFPNYEQIIPDKFITEVSVSKEEFQDALRIASTFARDLGNVVQTNFSSKESFVSASSNLAGESKIALAAAVKGQDIKIAFNGRYITSGAGVMTGEKIEIRFAGPVSPALIKSPEDPTFSYIVMPVRTQS